MSLCSIRYAGDSDQERWDEYVRARPGASLYHLFGWRDVFRRTYGHAAHYLMAEGPGRSAGKLAGVLPLIHFKHLISGNVLVSLPFVDGGGVLADSGEAAAALVGEAVRLGRGLRATRIELRQEGPLAPDWKLDAPGSEDAHGPLKVATRSDKVRMLLNLPASPAPLLASFRSKLRSQINRPLREGFACRTGGAELLEDFYRVFLVNMRDLGSPVHSPELMRHVLGAFPAHSRILVVYDKSREPAASALVAGLGAVLRNPWACALRKYAPLGPNMLLYLRMLEYARDSGYRVFDFGRSTRGEGTHRFKEQWGAEPAPLHWHYVSLDGKAHDPEASGVRRLERATHYWRKLPVGVTRMLGPRIRRHISL